MNDEAVKQSGRRLRRSGRE